MKKAFKKIFCSILVVIMCIAFIPENSITAKASIASGYCGPSAYWHFNGQTLTITGTGTIDEKSSGNFYPWGAYLEQIEKVVIEKGITSIPSYAFEYCYNLQSVTLPESLTQLAMNAFNDCRRLNNLLLPASLNKFLWPEVSRAYSLTDIYYVGTENHWSYVKGASNFNVWGINGAFTVHYLIDLSTKPTCQHGGTKPYYRFEENDFYNAIYDSYRTETYGYEPIKIPAVDHSYTNFASNNDATCTDFGTKTAYCDYDCGNSKTIVGDAYKPHNYQETVTPPECASDGFTTFVCKDCEYAYVDNYVDELGHDMSEFLTSKEVTCTVDGEEKSVCSRCDYYETKVIPALIHEDSDYDGYCEKCQEFIADKACCCICHSDSIFGLVYKILLIVQELTDVDLLSKVFKLGWLCDCNIAHY